MSQLTSPVSLPGGPRTYHTGSLTYTKGGLFVLSFWLLWGDFAFNL